MLAIHNLTHLKLEILTAMSGVAGIASSLILFFQGEELGSWLNTGIVIAFITAFIPSLFLLVIKLVEINRERQKEKKQKTVEDDARKLSYGERLVEMSLAERARLLDEREKDHHTEIKFYKYQLEIKKLEAIEARFRAHFYTNQANRASLHIQQLHVLMSQENLPIPQFQLASEEEMQLALQAEIEAYKQKLEKEKEAMIHLSDG